MCYGSCSSAMVAGVLLWQSAERIARGVAAKPVCCGLLLAASPVLLRLALLPHHPEPTPAGGDDFSYLLLSDSHSFLLSSIRHASAMPNIMPMTQSRTLMTGARPTR